MDFKWFGPSFALECITLLCYSEAKHYDINSIERYWLRCSYHECPTFFPLPASPSSFNASAVASSNTISFGKNTGWFVRKKMHSVAFWIHCSFHEKQNNINTSNKSLQYENGGCNALTSHMFWMSPTRGSLVSSQWKFRNHFTVCWTAWTNCK